MLSFRKGLAVLPERLGARLGAAARLETTAESVERHAGGFLVRARGAAGEPLAFPAASVVVALDSLASARVLSPLDPDGDLGVAGLVDIPYAGVAVTALGFRREDVEHPLDGFGFLAPRVEGLRHLGCLFVSSLFPGRAPAGLVALTAICGGATDPEAAALPDEQLLSLALKELTPLLGLKAKPVHVESLRWPRAIPQYNLGHGRFVGVAAGLEASHPGLHVVCNWRQGVSVADCITAGTALADRLVAGLAGR
jgi:oxygen-dependent protoporphyrinogen oxidase